MKDHFRGIPLLKGQFGWPKGGFGRSKKLLFGENEWKWLNTKENIFLYALIKFK